MFLYNNNIIVVRSLDREVRESFSGLAEFDRYCGDYGIDLSGYVYVDYEPERNLFFTQTPAQVNAIDRKNEMPVAAYDAIVQDVATLMDRKADPYFGIVDVEAQRAIAYGILETDLKEILMLNQYDADMQVLEKDGEAQDIKDAVSAYRNWQKALRKKYRGQRAEIKRAVDPTVFVSELWAVALPTIDLDALYARLS